MWSDSVFNTYGDEYGTRTDTKFGQATYYQMGDYVTMFGKVFTSKINNNTGHLPTTTDAYWQQVTWTDGVKVYNYPPDDFRLKSTDGYNGRLGLNDKEAVIVLPIIIRNFFIKKGKIKWQ